MGMIRRKKKLRQNPEKAPEKESPTAEMKWSIANMQGQGDREYQQDAFAVSRLEEAGEMGLLLVLCDGMGGMADGSEIAELVCGRLMAHFVPGSPEPDWPELIEAENAEVFSLYGGKGGTTLILCRIVGAKLGFCCVGDSSLYLLRGGELTELELRHEYKNDLLLRAIDGELSFESAFSDPQGGALSSFVGIAPERLRLEKNVIPFSILPGDTLLLCSDGVSDTLSEGEIAACLSNNPEVQAAAEEMERLVLEAAVSGQDNFTAIIARCERT